MKSQEVSAVTLEHNGVHCSIFRKRADLPPPLPVLIGLRGKGNWWQKIFFNIVFNWPLVVPLPHYFIGFVQKFREYREIKIMGTFNGYNC